MNIKRGKLVVDFTNLWGKMQKKFRTSLLSRFLIINVSGKQVSAGKKTILNSKVMLICIVNK